MIIWQQYLFIDALKFYLLECTSISLNFIRLKVLYNSIILIPFAETLYVCNLANTNGVPVHFRSHMEYCSHLWAGAPQYQLKPFDRIQRRSIRIIGDPLICEKFDTLAFLWDVSSLFTCLTYYLPHPACLLHHPHHLHKWQSNTVRFHRNSLPHATGLWNGLSTAVFPGRYDMGIFKKRVYLHLVGRQRTCSSSGVARGGGRR